MESSLENRKLALEETAKQIVEVIAALPSKEAIQKLGDWAKLEDERKLIAGVGGIEPLVELLMKQQDDATFCLITRALTNVSFESTENAKKIVGSVDEKETDTVVLRILDLLQSAKNNLELSRNLAALITNLTNEDDSIRNRFFKAGACPLLMETAKRFFEQKEEQYGLLLHSLKAMENSSKNTPFAKELIELGIVELLSSVLSSEEESVDARGCVVRALGSLGTISEAESKIRESGAASGLVSFIKELLDIAAEEAQEGEDTEGTFDSIVEIMDTADILVQQSDSITAQLVNANIHVYVVPLLQLPSEYVRTSALLLLMHISEKAQFGKKLLSTKLLPLLVPLTLAELKAEEAAAVETPSESTTTVASSSSSAAPTPQFKPNPTLRHIIKLVGCLALEDECMSILMEQKNMLFEIVKPLLNFSRDVLIQRNACIALGNLARSDENCAQIANAGFVKILSSLLQSEGQLVTEKPGVTSLNFGDANMKINATFALNNLCKAGKVKEAIMQDPGLLKVLVQNMDPAQPESIQFYSVECLANLANGSKINSQLIAEAGLSSILSVVERYKNDKPNVVFFAVKALYFMSETDESISKKVREELNKLGPETISLLESQLNAHISKLQSPAILQIAKNCVEFLKAC